jgi:putative oxidoreductase
MKRFLSTRFSDTSASLALLILRLAFGVLMVPHGFNKLIHFTEKAGKFTDPFHIGSTLSLSLVIFAEFFCALFIVFGLFTRFATIPLIIAMSVALFVSHNGDVFGDGEKAALYLAGYLALLLTGPGKISLDRVLGK